MPIHLGSLSKKILQLENSNTLLLNAIRAFPFLSTVYLDPDQKFLVVFGYNKANYNNENLVGSHKKVLIYQLIGE